MSKQITLSIALILLGAIFSSNAKAQEVPPEQITNGSLYSARDSRNSVVCDFNQKFYTASLALNYCSPIYKSWVEANISQFCSFSTDFYPVTEQNWDYKIDYLRGSSCTLASYEYIEIFEHTNQTVNQCPETHPYTVSQDATGQPTLCTDLSPNCPSGTTIGSDILTNSGLDTVCTPPTSGSQYYCSFQKKVGLDHSYQEYVVYTSTGSECSSLDNNVIDNPFIEPTDNPQPDPGCTAVSNEIQSCPANPADHCAEASDLTTCDANCGNYQGEFVCFSNMNPDNQDGDSEQEDNPNNDTDGDGEPDGLGVLQDIDKNTDELEKIGRDSIKAISELGQKLTNTGGTGAIDNQDGEEETPTCGTNEYLIGESCYSFTPQTATDQEDLDTTGLQLDIQEATQDIEDEYILIKNQLDGMFTFSLAGGTCSQNMKSFNVGGSTVQADFSICKYEDDLQIIGMVVIFLASLGAFFILIGGKNE